MARASTPTILSLDRFAQLAGISPIHFNQVYVPDLAPANASCESPMVQYNWQDSDRVGREEVAMTIAQVEDMLAELLGFTTGPAWQADERVQFPQGGPKGIVYGNYNTQWLQQSVQAHYGFLITGGTEAKSLIEAAVSIAYSDADGDGYDETATLIVNLPVGVTDPLEIALYYPGHDGETAWEVRPIKVTIASGVATIIATRQQLVLESLQEALAVRAVDGLVDANFLEEADVYRHYNDPSQMAQFMWESNPCGCWLYGCATCSFYLQSACLRVRKQKLGFFAIGAANWDDEEQAYTSTIQSISRSPQQVRLWYKAGDDLRRWERTVTNLTLAMLNRPMCACQALDAQTQYQREDYAYQQGSRGNRFQIGRRVKDNPIGSTRAAVNAWTLVAERMLGSSDSVGQG